MNTYKMDCPDVAATQAFAKNLGRQLRGGESIELVGDVGTGKTTFVSGLAKGIGSADHVSSPTFTVSNTYQGRLTLHHLDLYRLTEPGLITHQLTDFLAEPNAVLAIEWGGAVKAALPAQRIIIRFKIAKHEARTLAVSIPKVLDYITC